MTKGWKHTEEWKQAQSQRLKNQYSTGERKSYFQDKTPWNKGRTYNLEEKKKISEATKKVMNTPQMKEKISGENNCNWQGGRIEREGYIWVKIPKHPLANKNGYYQEHRLIVEEKIGRLLESTEVVHHLDENKTNNDIDNLMIFKSHGKHASFHNKIKQFGITNPIRKQIEERWNDA